MPNPGRKILALLLLAGAWCAAAAAPSDPASRIVLLVNRDAPDSLPIALHYAAVRGVPAANIVSLPMPETETVSWPEFVSSVWSPLQAELVRRGWINAIPMDLTDSAGRRKYAFNGNRIAALVVCRGVPLRIADDPDIADDAPHSPDLPDFNTNQGAVDSELSLLTRTDTPTRGYVPNPLFHDPNPPAFVRSEIVEVSRLDGPTAVGANALVDLAVAAERAGLAGRAVVDEGGPYAFGDQWLKATATRLSGLGFETQVEGNRALLPSTARSDAPVFYFGWYASNLNGPFALPGFRFPPGAIAVHIHSYSAATLHSETQGWCGPLLGRGITATVGNVYEPYLNLTHRPDLLVEALARGATWADAVYYSLPALSWQCIAIGDPLYRPFPEGQPFFTGPGPGGLVGYTVIRRMNLLEAAGRKAEALALGRAGLKEHPGLALALALARRERAAGDKDGAMQSLQSGVLAADPGPPDQWGLFAGAADFASESARPDVAVDLYRRLLAVEAIPLSERAAWLAAAVQAAQAIGDEAQAAAWKEDTERTVKALINGR